MAKIYQGILGGFSGKVGTIVGSIWKGINIIRSYNPNPTNPNTPAQLDQRAKFSAAIKFLRPMTAFVRVTYRSLAVKMSGFNAAMRYNLENAITGAYPNFVIDYPLAMVSRGSLGGVVNPLAVSIAPGRIDFTWDDNSLDGSNATDDRVLLLAYNPVRNQSVYIIGGGTRESGLDDLTLPALYSGETVECYIGFSNAKESVFSDSTWVGSVLVA